MAIIDLLNWKWNETTERARNPLRKPEAIALRVGRVIERFHMAKHFGLTFTDTSLSWHRRDEAIRCKAGAGRTLPGPHQP
jgi:hypothetical protein